MVKKLRREIDEPTNRAKCPLIKDAVREAKRTSWTLEKHSKPSATVLACAKCALEWKLRVDGSLDKRDISSEPLTESDLDELGAWLERRCPDADSAYKEQAPGETRSLYRGEGLIEITRQRIDRFFNNGKERRNGRAELPSKNVNSPLMPRLYKKVAGLLDAGFVLTYGLCITTGREVQKAHYGESSF